VSEIAYQLRMCADQISTERNRMLFMWLLFASSFVVIFEPAPTDLCFFLALFSFLYSGLRFSITLLPMVLLLLFYNTGGLISYALVSDTSEAQMFVITSMFMAVAAIFIAAFLTEDTKNRFEVITSGYVTGATIAATLAMLAYVFPDTIGKAYVRWGANSLIGYGRATGLFKDPNVFSTYLVFPCVMLAQRLLVGDSRRPLFDLVRFGLIFISLFLAFSRGAWINGFLSMLMMVGFTFMLSENANTRGRIAFYAFVGLLIIAFALFLILSSPEMQHIFLDRFTLVKNYDSGERGRFGNQINSIPMLMQLPLGFGPLQFGHIFREAPHNTFLNAFASYGWLGGISYITLVGCNLYIGLWTVFVRSPYRNMAILVFACLAQVIFQGVQIDTEHWRHFYWMLGMMWGLFAATVAHVNAVEDMPDVAEQPQPYYEVLGPV
jgi:hypothetical protein